MKNTQWEVGMEVTTRSLSVPTKIVKTTPTGIIVTADGRRFNNNGRARGEDAWLRPYTQEDAEARDRDRRASKLFLGLEGVADIISNMQRNLGRDPFNKFAPTQATIDGVERFLAAVRTWEAAEKQRGE